MSILAPEISLFDYMPISISATSRLNFCKKVVDDQKKLSPHRICRQTEERKSQNISQFPSKWLVANFSSVLKWASCDADLGFAKPQFCLKHLLAKKKSQRQKWQLLIVIRRDRLAGSLRSEVIVLVVLRARKINSFDWFYCTRRMKENLWLTKELYKIRV